MKSFFQMVFSINAYYVMFNFIKKFQKLDSSVWLYNQLQTFSTLIHTNLRYHKRIR